MKEARKATVQRQADELAEVITSDSLVTQLRKLISEAQGIAKEARRTRNLSVAMSGIDKQSRVLELIAKLTGQLDESARVNVLVQEREQREAGQATDLARLTVEERIQLEALLAKVRGSDDAVEVAMIAPQSRRRKPPPRRVRERISEHSRWISNPSVVAK